MTTVDAQRFDVPRAAAPRARGRRVVMITPWWSESTGGPSTYVRHLQSALERLGHEVHVVTWGNGPGARSVRPSPWLAARDIHAALVELSPEIVHVHSRLQGVLPAALYRARSPRARVFYSFHTMPHVRTYEVSTGARPGDGPGPRKALEGALYRLCDGLLSVSHSIPEALNEHCGASLRDYRVVRSGSDVVALTRPTREAARARFGLRGDAPLLVSVGVLAWDWKVQGHLDAIRAVARLRGTWPELQLFIAGDGPYRGALEAEVRHLDLERNVRLLGNVSDVPSLLAAADVYVHMAPNEGSPHALIEAMASGKPVVAARAGGIPELVQDGETGLLVASEDVDALQRALGALLADRATAARYARAAALHARAELTWERAAEACAAAYEERFEEPRRGLRFKEARRGAL